MQEAEHDESEQEAKKKKLFRFGHVKIFINKYENKESLEKTPYNIKVKVITKTLQHLHYNL